MSSRANRTGAALALAGAVALGAVVVRAERVSPSRPHTIVVGASSARAPMPRVDGRRTALTRQTLPTGGLVIEWRKALGVAIEQAPLVDAQGQVIVLTSRGDVYAFDAEGDERWRVTTGLQAAQGPVLLADGTVMFLAPSGEIVGVRDGTRRFQRRLSAERPPRLAPLPLEDGGAVVATPGEILFVDATGAIRARSTLDEPLTSGLLAAPGRILGVAASGTVYAMEPGRDAVRVGSFGGSVDLGAAMLSDSTLVAVVDQQRLVEVDWTRQTATTRATAPAGLYLGAPAIRAGTAYVLGYLPGRTFVLGVGRDGQDVLRAAASTWAVTTLPDGGAPSLVAPPHAGPLVDPAGTVAFVTPDGSVGAASVAGGVSTVGEVVCTRSLGRSQPSAGGLAPAGPNAFYVSCENGQLARITGSR